MTQSDGAAESGLLLLDGRACHFYQHDPAPAIPVIAISMIMYQHLQSSHQHDPAPAFPVMAISTIIRGRSCYI